MDLSDIIQGKPVLLCTNVKKSKKAFIPVCKYNSVYIVAAVLFDARGDVLMMQEAKSSCYGRWYLPAGKMEPDETIEDAVKREVQEETGLEMEPSTLLSVEAVGKTWFRFTLTGTITGGTLKTPAQKDSESIQAKFLPVKDINELNMEYPLRVPDIIPLIEIAVNHRNCNINEDVENKSDTADNEAGADKNVDNNAGDSTKTNYTIMPGIVPHRSIVVRPVIYHPPNLVLYNCDDEPRLPQKEIVTEDWSIASSLVCFTSGILGYTPQQIFIAGILSVEHDGRPARENDGLCISLLLCTRDIEQAPEIKDSKLYQWVEISPENAAALDEMSTPGKIVPLLLR